jgi:hypothetical protein
MGIFAYKECHSPFSLKEEVLYIYLPFYLFFDVISGYFLYEGYFHLTLWVSSLARRMGSVVVVVYPFVYVFFHISSSRWI